MTLKKVVDWAKKSVILRWWFQTTEEEYYMEFSQNLPDNEDGFVREMSARLILLYVSRKGAQDRNINLEVPGNIIKQANRVAEDLWSSLFKHHP